MSIYNSIQLFSNKLEKELGININNDYDEEYGEIQWHTPNYIIYLANRCHDNLGLFFFLILLIALYKYNHLCSLYH